MKMKFKIVMHLLKTNFLLPGVLIALLMTSLPAEAQTGELSELHLQFISFPKAAEPQEVELYLGDGESMEIEIPTNRISRSYVVKPMKRLVLGESTKDVEGNYLFKPYGQAASLNIQKQLILVLRKSRQNNNELALVPMPNTDLNFGGGSFFFMNATPLDIAGVLSDKKFVLKPGKSTIIKPSPSEVKGVYKYCKAQLLYRKGEEVRSFFNTTWRLNDDARSLIFLYQDPNTKHIRLHTIRDYL